MIDALYACPTCNGNCGSGTCATFSTNDCVENIELKDSEICHFLYSCADPSNPNLPATKPADWTVTADWNAALASGGLYKVNVIGDLPEPTTNPIRVSRNRTYRGKKTFAANLTIDEWTEANYNAMRSWECGATVFIWLQTLDGAIYGGENGIRVDITKANSPLTRGENQFKNILLSAEWMSKCHPAVTTGVDLLTNQTGGGSPSV